MNRYIVVIMPHETGLIALEVMAAVDVCRGRGWNFMRMHEWAFEMERRTFYLGVGYLYHSSFLT